MRDSFFFPKLMMKLDMIEEMIIIKDHIGELRRAVSSRLYKTIYIRKRCSQENNYY